MLAALRNALRCVGKQIEDVHIAVSGGGAAGSAIVSLLLAAGARDIVVWDREGILNRDDAALSPAKHSLAERTNPRGLTGTLRDAVAGADVFIGVSAPNVLAPEWIDEMAERPIVFALANPDPEVDIAEATKRAAVVASGRSDYPNQINNVLAFPGVFRGLLDARATQVTDRDAHPGGRRDRVGRHRRRAQRQLHRPERLRARTSSRRLRRPFPAETDGHPAVNQLDIVIVS